MFLDFEEEEEEEFPMMNGDDNVLIAMAGFDLVTVVITIRLANVGSIERTEMTGRVL